MFYKMRGMVVDSGGIYVCFSLGLKFKLRLWVLLFMIDRKTPLIQTVPGMIPTLFISCTTVYM